MPHLGRILKDLLNHTSKSFGRCITAFWMLAADHVETGQHNSVISSKSVKYGNNTFVSQSC